ncbi:MAG: DnaA/Hda family protein [Pseudomonadota bacterium]
MSAEAPPKQLPLALPHREAVGAEDFFVAPSNKAAVALVDRWPAWPAPAILISGPPGSGKSHMVAVWQSRSGGFKVRADALDDTAVAAFRTTRAVAIEDVDEAPNERLLFHMLNLARETGGTIMLTAKRAAGDLEPHIADLRSRLRAVPGFRIAEPDDTLLAAILVKQFEDRQLQVDPNVVSYLVVRLERSAAAARDAVAALDAAALAGKRRVTRALAAEVLADRLSVQIPDAS